MRGSIFILFCLISSTCFGQDRTSDLVNALVRDLELPDSANYYLVENSLWSLKITDTLIFNFPKRELYSKNPDLPDMLLGQIETNEVNWKNYNLNSATLITEKQGNQIIKSIKDVIFVDQDISNDELETLNKGLNLGTFIVKRKKNCSDKELWSQVEKAWNEIPQWKKLYYCISAPVFSKNYKYARVAVSKNRKCSGETIVYLYKNENNNWTKIAEFFKDSYGVWTSHVKCEDLTVFYKN